MLEHFTVLESKNRKKVQASMFDVLKLKNIVYEVHLTFINHNSLLLLIVNKILCFVSDNFFVMGSYGPPDPQYVQELTNFVNLFLFFGV